MFELIRNVIDKFFESRPARIKTGKYIVSYNECNETIIIHDQSDIKYNDHCDDLFSILMKCERLISYLNSKMKTTHNKNDIVNVNKNLTSLVHNIMRDIKMRDVIRVDTYVDQYSRIRAFLTATSMSCTDLFTTDANVK